MPTSVLAGPGRAQISIDPAATAGAVRLAVRDLKRSQAFYEQLLGMQGGYHHQIGLNTWNSRGGSTPPEGTAGLRSFGILLPNTQALEKMLGRVRAAGVGVTEEPDGVLVHDPSGNGLLLRASR